LKVIGSVAKTLVAGELSVIRLKIMDECGYGFSVRGGKSLKPLQYKFSTMALTS
jgi:hypothetical protein